MASRSGWVFVLVLGLAGAVRAEFRTWSDSTGRFKVEAELIESTAQFVRLKTRDGKIVRIMRDHLSPADLKHLQGLAAPVVTSKPAAESPAPGPGDLPAGKVLVTPPPANRGFDPLYRQHVDLDGFSLLGSAKVEGRALATAHEWIKAMVSERPEILRELVLRKVYLVVLAPDEVMTDLPEYANLTPKDFWDQRTRGIGATTDRLVLSCAQENLLRADKDLYAGEQVLVHEFAHTVHDLVMPRLDPSFDERLQRAYEAAKQQGLWQGTHAASNRREYWAEGVQSWFNANRQAEPSDGVHNYVNTREELMAYDPGLAALIDSVFP